jgi:hypothetical protein
MDLSHPINGGLISTIDLAMKFGLPNNKMSLLTFFFEVWTLCYLTPTIAIYLGKGGETFMGV